MKVPKQAWFVILVLTSVLWFYTALCAQESNALQNADSSVGATSKGTAVSAEAEEDKGREGIDRGPLVSIGRDVELKAGDSAEVVVVIGGSAKIHGKVRNAAVAIWGDLDVEGEVGDAAVAVMGDLKVGKSGKIHGEAVAVGGRVDAADTAKIGGATPGFVFLPSEAITDFPPCHDSRPTAFANDDFSLTTSPWSYFRNFLFRSFILSRGSFEPNSGIR